jgi:hypothetical protein
MSTIVCASCGRENEARKTSFAAVCGGCGAFLHSCWQCRLYCESSRSCASSTTDESGDPSHGNFCEEFDPLRRIRRKDSPDKGDASKRFLDLFGGGGGDTP